MIEQSDTQSFKRGQDVEIAGDTALILADAMGNRFRICVIGGVVTAVAV